MAKIASLSLAASAISVWLAALASCSTTTDTAERVALDRLCKAYPDSALCDLPQAPDRDQ
jgi:hypothetical protein